MSRRLDRIDWNDKPIVCPCGAWPAPIRTDSKKVRLCEGCAKNKERP